ncbi:MAG: NYN domain-containing protein [Thermodesulfovibrionales bacterium]
MKINIIIDGYNVIGVSHGDMKKQRDGLIELLISYHKSSMHEITLVFDGWKDGKGNETRTVTGGVTIIYSGLGERADDVIKRIISNRKKKWAVVSSDRDIKSSAWKNDCVPIDSELFYDRLMRSIDGAGEQDVPDEDRWEEDEYEENRTKRSPGKLSKKEKDIRRVIEKL